MSGAQFTTDSAIRAQIDGLLSWWALAGVDSALGEENINWLNLAPQARYSPPAPQNSQMQPSQAPHSPAADTAQMAANVQQAQTTPLMAAVAAPTVATVFPDDIAAFNAYLAQTPDLPEARWPGPRTLPYAPQFTSAQTQQPELMIILPAPDSNADASTDGSAPAIALRPEALRLLGNMLRCIGLTADQCVIATLSLIPPPGGMIDSDLIAPLARRMRHHISLIAPKAVLLVGDETKSALLSTNDGNEPKNSPFLSHAGGTVACAAILHPRLMLEQPSAKAEAWKSLRAFIRNREH